jgi:hypothetical protein
MSIVEETHTTSNDTIRYFIESKRPSRVAEEARGTPIPAESEARPVTVATAYRRKLWREGTLVYEDEWGAYEITEIFEDLTAHTEPSEPGLQRQSFAFRPEQTLMFAPTLGASNAGASNSDGEGDQDYPPFDEVDTKHALWHVRSALEDAECIRGRPILKMGITRDLRCAKRILSEHAERNGFEV